MPFDWWGSLLRGIVQAVFFPSWSALPNVERVWAWCCLFCPSIAEVGVDKILKNCIKVCVVLVRMDPTVAKVSHAR